MAASYKISYRGTKPVQVDLAKKSTTVELVELQLDDNDWYVRHARRLLQERGVDARSACRFWKNCFCKRQCRETRAHGCAACGRCMSATAI